MYGSNQFNFCANCPTGPAGGQKDRFLNSYTIHHSPVNQLISFQKNRALNSVLALLEPRFLVWNFLLLSWSLRTWNSILRVEKKLVKVLKETLSVSRQGLCKVHLVKALISSRFATRDLNSQGSREAKKTSERRTKSNEPKNWETFYSLLASRNAPN